jgi:hypothetical protein
MPKPPPRGDLTPTLPEAPSPSPSRGSKGGRARSLNRTKSPPGAKLQARQAREQALADANAAMAAVVEGSSPGEPTPGGAEWDARALPEVFFP